MATIDKALQARINKTLDTKVHYTEGIMTRRDWLVLQKSKGSSVKEVMKSKTKYSRTRFNRMDYREQEEYQKRLDTKVPCYELHLSDESFYDITKIEYDYFSSL